ncbi:ClbS/DfsB family four-helix bundle protein [Listeria grayi]|uniref:ClbS/DfsB family four-helix bundle protein n=1 Tax=Listeria grayi TaxID=1641 RepID=UPI001623E869|nr:ClbS/DfsB family four-helix bundle protein [Listeria grayi]MBC1920705.1 ClbS/DfsB family four-helix bundle protein [Listeria grayi]
MRTYADRAELVAAIQTAYQTFISEFENVPEALKDLRLEEVDKTPAEMLAYQLGWLDLLLSWEEDEKAGKNVQTPTADYKWNNLGGLYRSFYKRYEAATLQEMTTELTALVEKVCAWVSLLSERELMEPGQKNWATTKAMWPVVKWVHINTVAPFTNFRPKIRKWKKLAPATQ